MKNDLSFGGGWNYRFIRKTDSANEIYFNVHEVYYDEEQKPVAWSANPIFAQGSNPMELSSDLLRMMKGFYEPIFEIHINLDGKESLIESKDQSKVHAR